MNDPAKKDPWEQHQWEQQEMWLSLSYKQRLESLVDMRNFAEKYLGTARPHVQPPQKRDSISPR